MKKTKLLFIILLICTNFCKNSSSVVPIQKTDTPAIEQTQANRFSPDTKVSEGDYQNALNALNQHFLHYVESQKYISNEEAEKMWGHEKYDAKEFINGDEKTKASMVTDFIEQKIAIGKTNDNLEQYVGRRSGYFYNEQIFAEIFIDGLGKKKGSDNTYQLVFFPDRDGKIVEVRIHKQ